MPRTHPLYAFILLFALGLLGSAFYTLHKVQLSGDGLSSQDTFDLPEESPQKPLFLPQFNEPSSRDGKKAAAKYFRKQKEWEKIYAGSPVEKRLIRDYREGSPQKRMFLLMKARRTGGGNGYGNFFLYVYQNSSIQGRREVALLGLARANPKKAMEIIKRDIFGKTPSNYSWEYQGLSVLLQVRTDEAKTLLSKIAATHPDSRMASRAREYLGLLRKINRK